MVNALALSALSTSRFAFEGFLPVSKKERRERLSALEKEERTFILHEAPHKLRSTLTELSSILGAERKIAICRELTKLNEEIVRTTLGDAVELYSEREPRGEYVLVIEGASDLKCDRDNEEIDLSALKNEVDLRCRNGESKNRAIKAVAEAHGMSKNQLYGLLLEKE